MTPRRRMYWLLAGLLMGLVPASGFSGEKKVQEQLVPEAEARRPVVRVVSPGEEGTAFVLSSNASKIAVVLEITDVTDSGILADDTGLPRFFEANSNVDVFLHHLIARGTYTNGRGKTVLQLVSEIPVDQLVADRDLKITPPVDTTKLTKQEKEEGFEVPPDAMVQLAAFYFKVKDRAGAASWSDAAGSKKEWAPPNLSIGFASNLYRPTREKKATDGSVP